MKLKVRAPGDFQPWDEADPKPDEAVVPGVQQQCVAGLCLRPGGFHAPERIVLRTCSRPGTWDDVQ